MDSIELMKRVARRLPPAAAEIVLRVLSSRWYQHPRKRYDFESWHSIIQVLVDRVASCPEARARWRAEHPQLLVAEPIDRRDLARSNRRRQALAWWRDEGRSLRLVQSAFHALGYPDLETLCAAHDGFTCTRAPTASETRRLRVLETAARQLMPDLFDRVELLPHFIIHNPLAVWNGMAVCVPCADPLLDWHGLSVRYRLPYVALKADLLADGRFGNAMSTYLHELAHMFGGDHSAAFSQALSAVLALTCNRVDLIADLQRQWNAQPGAEQ